MIGPRARGSRFHKRSSSCWPKSSPRTSSSRRSSWGPLRSSSAPTQPSRSAGRLSLWTAAGPPSSRPPLGVSILADIDIPPQRHTGDIKRLANVLNGGGFVGVELFHQSDLFGGQGFAPAALASPGSCSGKSCLGALADDVALKLRKGAEDV